MLQVDTLKWKAVFRTRLCASCARKVTTSDSTSAATVVIKQSKSKYTMAGAFTPAPANHAKTECPPVIDSTVGRLCQTPKRFGVSQKRPANSKHQFFGPLSSASFSSALLTSDLCALPSLSSLC